jgi:hypothetical protein
MDLFVSFPGPEWTVEWSGRYLALALGMIRPFAGEPCFPGVGLLLPVAEKPIDLRAPLEGTTMNRRQATYFDSDFLGICCHLLDLGNVVLDQLQILCRHGPGLGPLVWDPFVCKLNSPSGPCPALFVESRLKRSPLPVRVWRLEGIRVFKEGGGVL